MYIITSIKREYQKNRYSAIPDCTSLPPVQFESNTEFKLMDKIEIDENCLDIKKIDGSADEIIYEKAINSRIRMLNLGANAKISKEENARFKGSKKIIEELKKASKLLARKLIANAPIIVRFHNDGDGASGAIALYQAFKEIEAKNIASGIQNTAWKINKKIAYTYDSFMDDKATVQGYSSTEKPCLFITDFGTTEESTEGISAAKGIFDIIWIDHHPLYEGFGKIENGFYINSWNFGNDSNLTAGTLSCMLAEVMSGINTKDLKLASLISDHSAYALPDQKAEKLSVFLDYVTSLKQYSPELLGKELNPKLMHEIINNEKKFMEIHTYAYNIMEDVIGVGMKHIKEYRVNGVKVNVLNFEHIAKLGVSYPPPGKFLSNLQGRIESKYDAITIMYYNYYVLIRISRGISNRVKILNIIADIKNESEYVLSGGGHNEAASIRCEKGHEKEVLELLLKKIRDNLARI
ncbi:MAG: DHH family phosphoesterase [Candidatus Micrarchaeia archaeon]